MSSPYRLFGLELSPYSVKVRSYLRYKGIEHEWVVRDSTHIEEFQRRAKLPLIPLLITPEDEALQDSTPILESLEARFPEPSIHPPSPAEARWDSAPCVSLTTKGRSRRTAKLGLRKLSW